MGVFPSGEEVEALREKYPKGSKVRLVQEPETVNAGTVIGVDSNGLVHVRWDGCPILAAYGKNVITRADDGAGSQEV